jgi:hypothetical protein
MELPNAEEWSTDVKEPPSDPYNLSIPGKFSPRTPFRILRRNIRWLAVVTGCITEIVLVTFLWLSLSAIVLIVDAAV